jgi:hypothetical protein
MHYRLIVADVDGTLVGADGRLAPGATAAVRRAEAAGARVALSTGRTPPACAGILAELPATGPHIFFDGGLVLDGATEPPVLLQRVDPAAVLAVLAFAEAAGLTAEVYTRDGYYVGRQTPEVAAHAALQGCAPVVTDLAEVVAGGEVIKAELVIAGEASRAAVRAFEPELAGRLRFSWATAPGLPHLSFINLVAPGVSKGAALAAAARHLGLALAQTVAIGDSANDLPMFEVAGLAVAMGNAPAAVQQAAHRVTGPVEAGGFAEAVERLLREP